jgi:hypothetical protein
MTIDHTFLIHAVCPVNGDRDEYRCTVTLDRIIRCEDLVAEAAVYADQSLYQEDLTQALAERWRATVRTVGTHLDGWVSSECVASPIVDAPAPVNWDAVK